MFPQTPQNTVHRLPKRAHYDTETIYAILDEGLIGHVAFTDGDQPVVIPTLYGRSGDTIYLHGAKASRMLKQIEAGHPISMGVTLVDGIVFARSVFHHSINYRSVVLFGHGSLVEEAEAKLHALEVLTEHIARGRWAEARRPTTKELNATSVIAVQIESASAKVRSGPPIDDEDDYALPVWAGVLPLAMQAGHPENDPRLNAGIDAPDLIRYYYRVAHDE